MIEFSGAVKEQPASNSFNDNRELLEMAQNEYDELSSKATEALIEKNQGLIKSIALRFKDRGVDFEDLMQIGTIGMLKAIRSLLPSYAKSLWRPTAQLSRQKQLLPKKSWHL